MFPQSKRTKRRRLSIPEALEALTEEEAAKLIDMERVTKKPSGAPSRMASSSSTSWTRWRAARPVVMARCVARGRAARSLAHRGGIHVSTKYGPLKTDHVLFIAAGAFHVAKPKDLIPELQGRFPIRVELDSLTDADFVRILTEPRTP